MRNINKPIIKTLKQIKLSAQTLNHLNAPHTPEFFINDDGRELIQIEQVNVIMQKLFNNLIKQIFIYKANAGRNTGSANKRKVKAYNEIRQTVKDINLIVSSIKCTMISSLKERKTVQLDTPDELKYIQVYIPETRRFTRLTYRNKRKITFDPIKMKRKQYFLRRKIKPKVISGQTTDKQVISKRYYTEVSTIKEIFLRDFSLACKLSELVQSPVEQVRALIELFNMDMRLIDLRDELGNIRFTGRLMIMLWEKLLSAKMP